MAMATDSEWTPIIERVEQQSTRMKAIVEDLLTLSRLDAASKLEVEESVAIVPLINAVVAEGEELSDGKHRFSISAQSEVDLRGSGKELRSAFTNLIANAVRYSPDGGDISLTWRCHDGWAEFSVKDNGPGIAAEHLPRLTERFYRASVDRSRASGGTGLGLAIVKHILMLHDGQLNITSEPGVGSEFICQFPNTRIIDQVSHAS
jgi:two-component system phosphate regulon sensor histidine kinase PhoR